MTRWQVFCAVALRKLPELMPKLTPIEARVQQIFDNWELANSKFSKHELQILEDAEAQNNQDESVNVILTETAQDREDRWSKERSSFSFGPYDDRLTRVQYIFVRQKFGSDPNAKWLLPQAEYNSDLDSDLNDTARRALSETLQINNGFRIVSKIPSSVYTYKYPKQVRERLNFHGAKVFFLKAHLDEPKKSVSDAIDSHKAKDKDGSDKLLWLTKDEAYEKIKTDVKYLNSFSKGLFHEERIDTLHKKQVNKTATI